MTALEFIIRLQSKLAQGTSITKYDLEYIRMILEESK